MHPISYTKQHPVGVITSMILGMMVGPWILGMVGGTTGINLSVPRIGGNSG